MTLWKYALPLLALAPMATSGAQNPNPQPQWMVLDCTDGDTCKVKNSENILLKVRLIGIDAPEIAHPEKKQEGQPMGNDSKAFLNQKIKGKMIALKSYGNDMYNRTLGELFLDGKNINIVMLENGMAEIYRGKPNKGLELDLYRQAEKKAKEDKKGIWALSNYVSPFFYRKDSKDEDN